MLAARFVRSVSAPSRVALSSITVPRIVLSRRSYAAAAAATATQHVKPPVQLFGVDGTYASALVSSLFPSPTSSHFNPSRSRLTPAKQYTAAVKVKELEQVDKTLQKCKQLLEKDASLKQILSTPRLDASSKALVVQTLSKAITANKATENFLNVLAENNRLGLLPGVVEQFSKLMKAHRGEIEAIVTSAQVGVFYILQVEQYGRKERRQI